MIKGKAGEWYQDEHIGGYFAEDGIFRRYATPDYD